MSGLSLSCPKCKRTMAYDRTIDPSIPAHVATIRIICDRCDDGDFHTETWFDASGNEVLPALTTKEKSE